MTSPESVVQRQLEAYNARDVDAWLATYADDAQQFEHPAALFAGGSAQLRERITVRFREPNLHARLIQRIVLGQMVIDHEEVSRTFPEGRGKIKLVAITRCETAELLAPGLSPETSETVHANRPFEFDRCPVERTATTRKSCRPDFFARFACGRAIHTGRPGSTEATHSRRGLLCHAGKRFVL